MNIIVFFLLIVIAVMALWIKELIYRWLLDAHHQFLLSLVYLAKEHGLEGASDFEVYAGGHRIDDIEIFKAVGRQLEKQPFVIERLSQLKKEYGD